MITSFCSVYAHSYLVRPVVTLAGELPSALKLITAKQIKTPAVNSHAFQFKINHSTETSRRRRGHLRSYCQAYLQALQILDVRHSRYLTNNRDIQTQPDSTVNTFSLRVNSYMGQNSYTQIFYSAYHQMTLKRFHEGNQKMKCHFSREDQLSLKSCIAPKLQNTKFKQIKHRTDAK